MKKYTLNEKEFILRKIPNMAWEKIPESLKDFWLNYKNVKL